jgi:hypothetical protein
MDTSSEADEEDVRRASGRNGGVDRMTARQRSKHDSSYTEDLMVLPEGVLFYRCAVRRRTKTLTPHHDKRLLAECTDHSKKMVLTEQEKIRRKEETARRRKLQADQRQENDKVGRCFAFGVLILVTSS